jgi:hypothetical protein
VIADLAIGMATERSWLSPALGVLDAWFAGLSKVSGDSSQISVARSGSGYRAVPVPVPRQHPSRHFLELTVAASFVRDESGLDDLPGDVQNGLR